ncbi:Cu-oxidase-domain-containing protein [Mycena rosella]|uniref:Cu-oxidase-domain-containing protein n=1 Tax=Mycena rosella TaxID=1033263 RepID=A0AAD7DAS8_MYCRO|nr:Cu-oxidase-domain-containing protein [Mycena rosella]
MLQAFVLSAVLLAALKPVASAAAVFPPPAKHVTLNVGNAQLAPDGFSRSTVVVNGQYPGPPILVNKGDSLSVTVNNRLTDPTMRRSTSLDLDGLFSPTSELPDEGSPFVTQCPIGPGASYTYDHGAIDQAGTFWYHSQLSIQYIDGFRGPLIVYDPNDPLKSLYDVDDVNTIIQLGDWWHNTTLSPTMLPQYEATGIIPVSDSSTINGAARYNGGPAVPWSVVNVVKGKRYRLRLINESARNVVTFNVEGHSLNIIEADGEALVPHVVNALDMLAGQRYSVVLTANQPIANYWIQTPFVGGAPARNLNQNITLSRAILRYAGAPIADPTTPMDVGPFPESLVEAELRPLVPQAAPPADVNVTLDLEVIAGQAIWTVNGVSFLPPKTPTLMKVLEGASTAADFNATENTFVFPAHKTIQFTFPENDDDDAHPLHMHGQNFWLIKPNSTDVINTVDPIKRDTAAAGANGMILRFRTDKPGPFHFHCHIFWHYQAGLATVLLNDPAGTRAQVHPDAAWEGLCPAYNALPADEQ